MNDAFDKQFYLIIGGIIKSGWALGLKFSHGFTELVPSVMTVLLILRSFYFFYQAMKRIPLLQVFCCKKGAFFNELPC
ncbi:DMT family transporter [Brevibacillus sp. NPDC003359]|uniref:DMT family transporter n=1 Tax=unclassified Brevibacillus TaxID=2684853 RepID=UPI0036829FF3